MSVSFSRLSRRAFIPGLAATIFRGAYEQIGNTVALWTDVGVDRALGGFVIPMTWFQALNPLLVISMTPLLLLHWRRSADQGRETSPARKMAIGALHCLNRRRVAVPERVSVIGFDDMRQSAFASPSLTTVHLPLYEVGLAACERLIDRVRGKQVPAAEVLPTHLVVRESTAMAPTARPRTE
jgi:hypothetical protein